MKKYTVITMVGMFILALFAFAGQLFGQTETKERPTGFEALQKAYDADKSGETPLILYPYDYLQYLYDLGYDQLPSPTPVQTSGEGGVMLDSESTQVPEYMIVDLGTLGGNSSEAYGISDDGKVVGWAQNSGGVHRAFLNNGIMQDLGTLGGNSSEAYGISASGHVVGRADYSGYYDAFLYTDGMIDLGRLGGNVSSAQGANDNNQVAGWSENSSLLHHAVRWENSAIQDLGTLGGNSSEAYGISSSGQVVGWSYTNGNSYRRSFLYDGTMQNIGTLGGNDGSAYGISHSGHYIVGYDKTTNNQYHAYRWENGAMTDLGSLPGGNDSYAYGANDAGWVVGTSRTNTGPFVRYGAFLYAGDTLYDLNGLVVNGIGWVLQEARGINNSGQIAGTGINPSGRTHAFRLDPVLPGWQETYGTQLPVPVFGNYPTQEEGKDSIVVITHGWQVFLTPIFPLPDVSWVDSMSNNISTYLTSQVLTNWQVFGYKWVDNAWKFLPTDALNNAKQEGFNLGSVLATQRWAHVHLIGHSAGAGLIQEASEWIKSISSTTTVQCTFLDPYVGKHFEGTNIYGTGADWSDQYFSRDALTTFDSVLTGPFTESPLNQAYNADVTALDPHKITGAKFWSSETGELESCIRTYTSHGWPFVFYANTVTGDTNAEYKGFGFPLSKEGGDWDFATNQYVPGNGALYGSVTNLGTPDPSCFTEIKVNPTPFSDWVADFVNWFTQKSNDGSANKGNGWVKLNPGSPVWLATFVTPTNPINTVSFDAVFVGTNGSDSLLAVYWDTNVIGTVDELYVDSGFQHYSLQFPQATVNGTHVLGLRLDPYSNAPSSIILTNVMFSQRGVSQQFSLSVVSNSSNGLIYELNGEAGFEYRAQTSTNLTDWTDIAVLQNTNGIVHFYDPEAVTNSYPQRFYRAVGQ